MFEIKQDSINDIASEKERVNSRAGAVVTFEGRVRNHNEGFKVKSLEYQCYESMALKEGQAILAEALDKFDVMDAYCVHREGHLKIGDMAVWVYVSSAHRREAFEACQFIIDEVKLRVPIWKREHYVDKKPEWVACHRCSEDHLHEAHHAGA